MLYAAAVIRLTGVWTRSVGQKSEVHLSLGLRDGLEIRTLFRQRTSNQTYFEPKFPEDIS